MTKKKGKKLNAAEVEWLRDMKLHVAEKRLTLEDFDREIGDHRDEITSHREHIKLLRGRERIAQKGLGKAERMLAKWRAKKGMPA